MIPTLIIVGLVLGKWWRVVVPVAATGWAVLLIATGVGSGVMFALGAAAFGVINVAFGVLIFQGARLAVRKVARKPA